MGRTASSQNSKAFPCILTHSKLYQDKLSDEMLLASNVASKLTGFQDCHKVLSPGYLINPFMSETTYIAIRHTLCRYIFK